MVKESILINDLKSDHKKEQAFKILLNTYQERLYWHIRKIVLSHDDADDVLQNTFIKVYKNIDNFKADSKLFTWLYRIATNESLTFLKKKAKRLQISTTDLKNEILNNLQTDVYFEGDKLQIQFQKAIATLPERQQLIFNMKYFEDFTFIELSEILDTSVGGLKSSYHHAVKKIKKYIVENETL